MTDQEIAATISTGRSEDSATPLHIAAHYGHKDVIRSLLVILSIIYNCILDNIMLIVFVLYLY